MHPLNVLRGYSDFFKSGFREFTNRDRRQSSASHNSDTLFSSTSSLTPQKTASGATNRRRRAVSMIVEHTPRENLQQRRSSFLSFSSQWFDHRSATTPSFDETSTISSTTSISSVVSRDSLPEVWISGDGSYTALNESSHDMSYQSIDPFSSSPDAKSTFMELSQDDSAHGISKRDSFLSFTPSFSRSTMTTRSERLLSIQTTHLPSRQSSSPCHHHHHHHRPFSPEKPQVFGAVEEEEENGPLLSSHVREVGHMDWDAPAQIDWRQFHVDVLTNDDMKTL